MYVALAGVTALFRREIKPFERYEMRSRVLTWDGKWVFVVTHFVKCGKPREGDDMSKRIYASCLSKYVCKMGRKTVPPEEVLMEAGVLPPRPEGCPPPDFYATMTPEGGSGFSTPLPGAGGMSSSTPDLVHISASTLSVASTGASMAGSRYGDVLDKVLEKSLALNGEGVEWTWQRIERERKRGMEIAKAMLALDRLDGEVKGVEKWGRLH